MPFAFALRVEMGVASCSIVIAETNLNVGLVVLLRSCYR